ncbi:MAG: ArsR/SmtB family transcription factor [Methanohalobium sp.]
MDETLLEEMKISIPCYNTVSRMSRVFQALQSTTRLKILFLLSRKDMCVCEMVYTLGMTQSAISHSLRVLNHLGLVSVSKKGKFAVYSIADEHVITLVDMCLEHVTEQ